VGRLAWGRTGSCLVVDSVAAYSGHGGCGVSSNPCQSLGPERAPSSNLEFLQFVFGEGTWVWGAAFSGDPHGPSAKFKGKFAQLPAMPIKDNADLCNTYFCCSRIKEKGGQRQRKDEFFDGLAVLVIDDVGVKGRPLDEISAFLRPTYVIHTSDETREGKTVPSYQVGYVFKEAVTNRETAQLLVKRLAAKEGDKSGNSVVRVVRLPFGMNTKGSEPRSGQPRRTPNKVVLYDWSGIKYTTEDVIEAFGARDLGDNIVPISLTSLGRPGLVRDSARGSEGVGEGDVYRRVSIEEIEEALSFLDPAELAYEEGFPSWLAILMSVHSEQPGPEGRALVDTWCRRGGERYMPGEVDKRWSGFSGRENGYTIATLIKCARDAGWKPDKGVTLRDEFLADWGKRYAVVQIGNKVRVLMEDPERSHTPEVPPYTLLSVEDFRKWTATQSFDDPADGKVKLTADAWFRWQYRREFRGVGCYPPGAPSPPNGYFNGWRGFALEPAPGDCSLWHRHVLDVYCSGNCEHYDWIIKWLATLVQFPGKPVGTALACRGEEGTGKGAFWHPFIRIFGSHCVQFIDQQQMESQFTGLLEGKVLVLNNEAYWGGNSKAAGKLKGLITESYVASERKGIEAYTVFNPLWFGFMSNSEYYIPADKFSRRFMANEISGSHKQDADYFWPLFDQLDNGGTAALLHELLAVELTDDDLRNVLRNPPVTVALLKQGNRTHEDFAAWVQQLALEGVIPVARDEGAVARTFFPSKEAFEDFARFRKEAGLFPATKGHNNFGKLLRDLGVKQAKPRLGRDRKQTRCYELPRLGAFRQTVQDTYPCDELEDFDPAETWGSNDAEHEF